ncbi:MAG TPA: IS110 family transposase [Candidatus Binatia bacterium]|jgi:transposase|nr:IS110 family transposase [Candidatus Binatia bacterium]
MRGKTFIPADYDLFAGLDVDKKSISVTFTDHQGFIQSKRIPYNVEHLLNYVRKHFTDKKVAFAYEAGPTGYGLYDGLVAQAYPCLIAAPSMIPKAPGQRVKTNRLDSRGLSENLRGGQLKSIHVPSPLYRELRHLTQLRDTMMSEVAAMKQRIKSLLLFEGIDFPPAPAGSQWSFIVKDKLRKLPCSKTVRFKLDQLLDSLEFSEKQAVKATKEIRRFCNNDAELSQCIKYLMTIPGIGWIVASQLVARIGDWRELKNVRQLAGFLGLVPTENSTGDRTDRGSITHTGDGRLRSKLIQASWSAIRQDGELREFFRSVCRTHPRNIASRVAIVAVARKLSTRISAVLMEQRPYVVREKVHSAPLTQEETSPQGTTRRLGEPGDDKQLLTVRSLRQRSRGLVP